MGSRLSARPGPPLPARSPSCPLPKLRARPKAARPPADPSRCPPSAFSATPSPNEKAFRFCTKLPLFWFEFCQCLWKDHGVVEGEFVHQVRFPGHLNLDLSRLFSWVFIFPKLESFFLIIHHGVVVFHLHVFTNSSGHSCTRSCNLITTSQSWELGAGNFLLHMQESLQPSVTVKLLVEYIIQRIVECVFNYDNGMKITADTSLAMATLESVIEVYMGDDCPASEQASSCKAIANQVAHGKLTMQNLVLTLGTYLTTTDNIVRARGTLLLSDILAVLSATALEDTAIKSLSNFFSSRLGDWHCLRGALQGCLVLLRRTSSVGAVEVEGAKDIANSALENLHVQALAQHDRKLCLELYKCLLDKHSAAVAPLEGDLVFGIVAAIEEEKDPRCLLLAFQLIEQLSHLYPDPDGPVGSCVEELFDVVSRYFPISFNPQPGSPDVITRDDLSTALKKAVSCTPLFAPFCIPLLLEKLSSSLRRAKLDSLSYLGHCALAYGAKAVKQYSFPVWEALKSELLPPSVPSSATSSEPKDAELVKEATSCLISWTTSFQSEKDLSLMAMKKAGIMEAGGFLHLILKDECIEDLIICVKNDICGPENSEYDPASLVMKDRARHQAQAIGHVLAAAAQASPSSCFVVCNQVLKRLTAVNEIPPKEGDVRSEDAINISMDSDQSAFRSVSGLNIVNQVILAARSLAEKCFKGQWAAAVSPAETSGTWMDPLREQSEGLSTIFHQSLLATWSNDLPAVGVTGLQALASFPAVFSPLSTDQLKYILLTFKKLLISDSEQQEFYANVLTAVENISNVEEQSGRIVEGDISVLTVIIPELLDAVREGGKTGISVKRPLRALAAICGQRPIARQLVIENLTQIIRLEISGADGREDAEEVSGKLVDVLKCLSESILPWCNASGKDQLAAAKLAMEIWSVLYTQGLGAHQEVLKWSMQAIRAAVVKCDAAAQRDILLKGLEHLPCTETFQLQQISSCFEEKVRMSQSNPNKRKSYEEEKGWSVALVTSVVVSLRPTTEVSNKQVLLNMMMRAAQSKSPLISETAAQAVASLLNKWVDVSIDKTGTFTMEDAVDMVLEKGWLLEITSNNSIPHSLSGESMSVMSVRQKVCGVQAVAWVGKGLAMRGHSRVADVASFFLKLLLSGTSQEGEASSLYMAAAEGLGAIVKDTSDCLNKLHHAIVRPLYKQRFFNSMLSPLVEAVRTSGNTNVRLWLHRGIAQLISGIPHVALLADGKKAFPVLLGALQFLSTDSGDSDLLLSTLLALSAFLVDVDHGRSIAEDHVSSIVKHLLALIAYRYSVVVREIVLQCLTAIVALPYSRLYPLRQEVLRATTVAVDDKKRVVRKEAVRCRQAWAAITSK